MNAEQLLEKAMSLSKKQLIKIVVDLLKEQKEFSSHYIAKEIKPTTDIDEVRKIFEETFTATNEDTADLYDDIWNFFEPYLKGGE